MAVTLAVAAPATPADHSMTPPPDLPDATGFAGNFAGVHRDHLPAVGGANSTNGMTPWVGGRKV